MPPPYLDESERSGLVSARVELVFRRPDGSTYSRTWEVPEGAELLEYDARHVKGFHRDGQPTGTERYRLELDWHRDG